MGHSAIQRVLSFPAGGACDLSVKAAERMTVSAEGTAQKG